MNTLINQQGNSGVFDLSILKQAGNIFIMDNHMAASWCWAQKIDTNQTYNLMHIDKHYDLLDGGTDKRVKAITDSKFEIQSSTIQEYCSLTYPKTFLNEKNQVFRYDNYMTIFKKLFPEIFKKIKFATHKDGTIPADWSFYEIEIIDLPTNNVEYWINENDLKWIINIDVDFFFTKGYDDKYFQFLTDEYILTFARQLKNVLNKIEVITIALSPTFCGGIEKSDRIAKMFLEELK